MRTLVTPFLFGLILLAGPLFFLEPAHATAQGGFTGPGPAMVTVKQALDLGDDARVSLKGHIVRHLGDDKYLFRDATGEIRVEIDHDRWQGQHVSPEDMVELYGKVDKEWNNVEVDVKRVIKR